MEYIDTSKPKGYDSYLKLVSELEALQELAWKSLDRGEMLPGRAYRRGIRNFRKLLDYARDESLRCSSRNPDPI